MLGACLTLRKDGNPKSSQRRSPSFHPRHKRKFRTHPTAKRLCKHHHRSTTSFDCDGADSWAWLAPRHPRRNCPRRRPSVLPPPRSSPVHGGVGADRACRSIYDVKGGTRAVIFDRLSGVKQQVVEEGTHFLVPWLQKAIIYDVRTKPRNISTTTGSKDLQMVSLTLRVLHRPNVIQLPKIYQVHPLLPTPLFVLYFGAGV